MSESDGEVLATLLQRVAQGSEPALEQLYRLVHRRIYVFALRRLNDPVEAADVVNETMLEVWRSAARFQGRAQVLTWILGIAHHKVTDAFRRRDRAESTDTLPEIECDDDPRAAVAALQDAKWLRHCIERLSDAHRSVVHLAFFDDLSYPDIAQVVGCPVGTIKTRMLHAKRLLKACVAALLGEEACSA